MQDKTNIYTNIDTLEFSILGTPELSFLSFLREKKQLAQQEMQAISFKIEDVDSLIYPTGLAGGYAFIVDMLGEFGFKYFIKDSLKFDKNGVEMYNIKVKIRAGALALYGLIECKKRIAEHLDSMGVSIGWGFTVVSRLDFAIDIKDNSFILDPLALVGRGKVTQNSSADVENIKEFSIVRHGRNYSGVTMGKMPNKQVCIYNKTKEVKQKKKNWWFDIWGLDIDSGASVWRFELRAGKKYLQDRHGIRTIEDMEKNFLGLFSEITENIRYSKIGNDTNASRWEKSVEWEIVVENLKKFIEKTFEVKQVNSSAVKNAYKLELKNQLDVMARGVIMSSSILSDVSPEEMKPFLDSLLNEYNDYIETDKGKKHLEKARKRIDSKYNFIEKNYI